MIEVEDLSFHYRLNGEKIPILKHLSFNIQSGEFVAIQGPSGSGKSTLFYVLGCLLKPKSGSVRISGTDISTLTNTQMSVLRNKKIGFVFQHFHLLSRANVIQNITLPSRYPCELTQQSRASEEKALSLADRFGLKDRLSYLPNQLSGGQQQRVAIARALMNDVDLILADEPTGNLDSKNAAEIMAMLKELNQQGKTVVLITHDNAVAAQAQRVIYIKDGAIENQSKPLIRQHPSTKQGGDRSLSLPNGFAGGYRTIKAVFPLALASLRRNKLRSALTMLGVTIGIASVFAMVTFGKYTEQKILESYEALGANKLTIWGYPNSRLKAADKVAAMFQSFKEEKDIPLLKHIFSSIQLIAPVYRSWGERINFGGRSIEEDNRVTGANPDYLSITNREIWLGRAITPHHVDNYSPVCVIGSEIVEKLFLNISPIGQVIFISGGSDRPSYPCQVIGVMKPQTSNKDWVKPNREVVLPSTYFRNVNDWWYGQLRTIVLQAKSGSDMEKLAPSIKAFLKHKYGPSGDFNIDSDAILIAQMKKFLMLFTLMLTSIALLSLLVGGIGINNMMLVSVNERLKEIGLLKAVGATDRSVRLQFLTESTLLCGIAGTVGVAIGFAAYEIIIFAASKFVSKITFEWVFDPIAFGLSVFSILLVGVLSGLTPAMKAEKLEVIEALRSE